METSFIIWPQVTGTTYIPDVPAVLNRTHTAGFRSSNWRSTKRKNDFSSTCILKSYSRKTEANTVERKPSPFRDPCANDKIRSNFEETPFYVRQNSFNSLYFVFIFF